MCCSRVSRYRVVKNQKGRTLLPGDLQHSRLRAACAVWTISTFRILRFTRLERVGAFPRAPIRFLLEIADPRPFRDWRPQHALLIASPIACPANRSRFTQERHSPLQMLFHPTNLPQLLVTP